MENKNFKHYVDYVLSFFERLNCGVGQGLFLVRTMNATAHRQGCSQEDLDILNRVVFNLYLNRFIETDKDYYFFKLLQNGYDYIQGGTDCLIHAFLPNLINYRKDEEVLFKELWLLIGREEKAPFYVPDTLYYNTIISVLPNTLPSFSTYIQERTDKGLSMARVVWYKELLHILPKEKWETFLTTLSDNIDALYHNQSVKKSSGNINLKWEEQHGEMKKKRIFVSYTHEDEKHNNWVRKLANDLKEHFEVIIDEDAPLGEELTKYMEDAVTKSDKTLLILTPTYKQKADNRENGVGYESQLITDEIWKQTNKIKYIPIVKKGDFEKSYPKFLGSRNGLDMTEEDKYESALQKLIENLNRFD